MNHDLDESLDAQSEFIMMGESLDAISQKIAFNNTSAINNQVALDTKKTSAIRKDETYEESQNEFLNVSKWKKGKESMIKKDMAKVEMDVKLGITQNKWQKKPQKIEQSEQDAIADESCVPEQEDNANNEEIADETIDHLDVEDQDETTQGANNNEGDDQQESSQESAEDLIDRSQKNLQTALNKKENSMKAQSKPQSATSTQRSKQEDDITDAQSQMKRTDYLPSKWSKKQSSQLSFSQSSPLTKWARQQIVLKRILLLVQ